jgi:RNA polymerase sigma factor (sigma-70 family)
MTDKELHKIQNDNLSELTNEDRIELFEAGDFNKLIKSYILFFRKKAIHFAWNNTDLQDEYLSIMLEGAAKALTKYDPNVSQYINSYICTSGLNNLHGHFKSISMKKRTGVTVEYLDYMDERKEDTVTFDEEPKEEIISITLDEMFESLNDKDRKVMTLLREGKTQREIGDMYGCTHQNINAKVKRIIKQIQNNI